MFALEAAAVLPVRRCLAERILGLLLALLPVAAHAQGSAGSAGGASAPSLATAVSQAAGLEGRVLWMDATANLQRLSSFFGVNEVFDRAASAGINTVVVDVKPLSGEVLYPSRIAPRLKKWRGFAYPPEHDLLLQTMLAARRRRFSFYVSINVFSEAHKLIRQGPLYDQPERQSIVYDAARTVIASTGVSHPLEPAVNSGPAGDGLAAYDATLETPRLLREDEAMAVIEEGRVTALVDGALVPGGGARAPEGGHLLIGRGQAAAWLLEHLAAGQPVTYTAAPLLHPILEASSELVGGFVNPADPVSREYALSIIHEIATRYAIDGIVLDRMRYSSIRTDFSDLSRRLFEKSSGKKVERWPEDIFEYDPEPGRPLIQGPLFKEWLEWRAGVIRSFVQDARELAARVRPGMGLAVYAGSWYQDYYGVGVNWGAPGFHPGYDWMTPGYDATGYAPLLDWITTGCYYPLATRAAAREQGVTEDETVEAAAQLSTAAVDDATFVYAGLYLLDYRDRPDAFRAALEAAARSSQGVMLFDLVYLEDYNWWKILQETWSTPRQAPHQAPGLVEAIRRTRSALRGSPASAASATQR